VDNATRGSGQNVSERWAGLSRGGGPTRYEPDRLGIPSITRRWSNRGDLLGEAAAHAAEDQAASGAVSSMTPVMAHGDPRACRGVMDVYMRLRNVVEEGRGRGQGRGLLDGWGVT